MSGVGGTWGKCEVGGVRGCEGWGSLGLRVMYYVFFIFYFFNF